MNISRRRLLSASASVAAASFFGLSGRAFSTVEDVKSAIDEFSGGADVLEGAVSLTTPEIAENGNSVPVTVAVESPMTDDNHVESVMILADGNPNPDVITFHFTPQSGLAKATTRIRLAQSQNVLAVARMSDGSIHQASNNVKVTIGGCGG